MDLSEIEEFISLEDLARAVAMRRANEERRARRISARHSNVCAQLHPIRELALSDDAAVVSALRFFGPLSARELGEVFHYDMLRGLGIDRAERILKGLIERSYPIEQVERPRYLWHDGRETTDYRLAE